jgi:Mechanosensitive ion channel, conserved TM helix
MLLQMNVVVDSARSFLTQLGTYLPRLLGAILVLVVGWLVAKWIRTGVTKLLGAVHFDDIAKRSGIDQVLQQGGLQSTLGDILAGLIYWTIILITLLAAVNSLGLTVASDMLSRVVLYLPNVVVAVIILILGALFGRLIQGIVRTYLSNAQVGGAGMISNVAYYAILVFAAAVTLEQLGIGQALVVSTFQIAFGALCLALAIAFGLGGRDWASGVINRTFNRPGLNTPEKR